MAYCDLLHQFARRSHLCPDKSKLSLICTLIRTFLMKPELPRHQITRLIELPNVGKACIADLHLLGIEHPQQLIGRDPYRMYDDLCRITGTRHDPCVYDVFISAVRYMEGAAARDWWAYTAERKAHLLAQTAQNASGDPAQIKS